VTNQTPIAITYFSDVLCVWAYVTQIRLDEIVGRFGTDVKVDLKFCSVFGNSADKISRGWADKRGYKGFNLHLKEVAKQFNHVEIHPDVWLTTRPASSDSAHLFAKAIQILEANGTIGQHNGASPSTEFIWRLRCAFFRGCRDISDREVQLDIAQQIGIPATLIEREINGGVAFAGLAADYQDRDRLRIEGSPTFVLNQGRQKLYGNLGYRVIEANIRELLREPRAGEMSWC
jgi:predicted DsbA family dithiol-disulfide isomerase